MNILDKIIEDKKKEIAIKKIKFPLKIKDIKEKKPKNLFFKAIKNKELSIIAEIKRKSPSAGIIRGDFNHIKIAKIYKENGASAISILTDSKYFGGKLDYISDIKKEIDIPILRKEFIVDEYQIYESYFSGADAILLIVKALSKQDLKKFVSISLKLGLSPLVEAHSIDEVETALESGTNLIGINNRNLDTMKVDLTTSLKLIEEIPPDYLKISESGIKSYKDIKLLKKVGFDGFLIGESLMREQNIASKLKLFLGD